MVKGREVLALYLSEVRMALRERNIVVYSILLPILLYPLMLFVMFTAITFVEGQTEGMVARVALLGRIDAAAELRRSLQRDDRFKIVSDIRAEDAKERVRTGQLDLVAELDPVQGDDAALSGNFEVHLTCDLSKERSVTARDRLTAAVARFRDAWLRREAVARRISPETWSAFTLADRNLASGRQMGARILGVMLPVFFVVMVAIGCIYPAIDATAGERERGTWETLMSTAASRLSIVAAKYLYVASFGCMAGILNLIAMLATIRPILEPLLARSGEHMEFAISPGAVPVIALGAVFMAAFVAAGMMILAAFARTFKEGQAMIMPFYLLIILPVALLQDPDAVLTTARSLIPVTNVAMTVREAIVGSFRWPQIGLTYLTSTVLIAAMLRLAAFILSFEDVVIGSYSGSFKTFLTGRLLRSKRTERAREGA